MNYKHNNSLTPITPSQQDTPTNEWDTWKGKLIDRTHHNIPFFLMPVRIETRFLYVTENLFNDIFSDPIVDVISDASVLTDAVIAYGAYQGFNTQIAFNTGKSIQNNVAQLQSKMAQITSLMPVEKHALLFKIKVLDTQLGKTLNVLNNAISDQNLKDDLENNIIPDVEDMLVQMKDDVDVATSNDAWEGDVSNEVKNTVAPSIEDIINDNTGILTNMYDAAGAIKQRQYDDFLASNTALLNLLRTSTFDNSYDKQYVWRLLNTIDGQLSNLYSAIDSLKATNITTYRNFLFPLYRLTSSLRDTWKSKVFDGIAENEITPFPGSENYKFIPATFSSSIVDLGTDVDDALIAANTKLQDVLSQGTGWDQQLFDDYAAEINSLRTFLDSAILDQDVYKAYISLKLEPVNEQFFQLKSFVAKLNLPVGNGAQLQAYEDLSSNLSGSWDVAISTEFEPVDWFTPFQPGDELWIRVYPDEIFIHSHEKALTQAEADAGQQYWTSWYAACGDPNLQLAAWQTLVNLYGPERAAWIIRATGPTNLSSSFTSSVFKVVQVLNLLDNYTSQLSSLFKLKEVALSVTPYLGFYTDQLVYLNSKVRSITALPESHAKVLFDTAKNTARNFNALSSILNAIDGEEKQTFAKISSDFDAFLDAEAEIALEDGWEAIDDTMPTFSQVDIKSQTWESASYSKVMPDRFLFAAIDDYTVNGVYPDPDNEYFGSHRFKHVKLGKIIPDPLYTGIDPQSSSFSFDTINNLEIDNNIKWMVDFPTAIARGMATRIRISAEEKQKGFDKLIVLGVKVKETNGAVNATSLPGIGKGLLEELLDNHHYTYGGMEILQLGSAVKNTDEDNAAYKQKDNLSGNSFQTETQGPLFTISNTTLLKRDGQWLADALGIDYSVLQHIRNADKSQISNSIAMNRALWEGTAGNFMKEMLNFLCTDDNVARTKKYFTDYVLGRGALPSIRVAEQPYGILPTTCFSRWTWRRMFDGENIDIPTQLLSLDIQNNTASISDVFQTYLMTDYQHPGVFNNSSHLDAFLEDRYKTRFMEVLKILNKTWLEMANWHVKTVDKNTGTLTAQQDFVEILGSDALMAEAYSRALVNNSIFSNQFDMSKSGHDQTSLTAQYYASSLGWFDQSEQNITSLKTLDGPKQFFELFNDFKFDPLGIPKGPEKLGGEWGIYDIPSFLKYKDAFDDLSTYTLSTLLGLSNFSTVEQTWHTVSLGESARQSKIPIPDMERFPFGIRILMVSILKEKYKLYGPTVAESLLSEQTGIPPINNKNYIQYLRHPKATLKQIANENEFSTMWSRSLLFLLLRQSTLLTYRETAMDAWEKSGVFKGGKLSRKIIGKPEGIAYQHFHGDELNSTTKIPILTHWHFLFNSTNDFANSPLGHPYRLFTAFQIDRYGSLVVPSETIAGIGIGNNFISNHLHYPAPDPNVVLPSWHSSYPNLILANYLKDPTAPGNNSVNIPEIDFTKINAHNAALDKLATSSTAELDRLLREHVDLCTYRLDAWNYGMVNKRLWEHRNMDGTNSSGTSKTGIYLGAYGWLVDVRPKQNTNSVDDLKVVATNDLPSHLTNASSVFWDPTNLGFINTPSNSHALAAALLRCGYVSENKSADNRFAVNLSSERVMLAKSLIEGVRNGQTLEALLGIEFERNLRDNYNLPTLNTYIIKLRARYPLKNSTNNPGTARPVSVVNAAALLKEIKNSGTQNAVQKYFDTYPQASLLDLFNNTNSYVVGGQPMSFHYPFNTGSGNLPPFPSTELTAIMTEVDRVHNAIDSLGDLLLAEGVFQVAKGNFEKSSATLEAFTEGKNPPDLELIETPKRGIQVTHRLAGMFEPFATTANPWTAISLTPRAKAEPNVNNWASKIILSICSSSVSNVLNNIACTVSFKNINNQPQVVTVRLVNLGLQPIDLMYLTQSKLFKEELINRVKYYARINGIYNTVAGIPQEIPLEVNLNDKGSATLGSFYDLHTALFASLTLISGSKWLQASDFAYSLNNNLDSNIPLYDSAEFIARATTLRNDMVTLLASMENNYVNNTVTSLTNAKTYLRNAAGFGVNYAMFNAAVDTGTAVIADISSLTKKVIADIKQRKIKADSKLAQLNTITDEQDKMKVCSEVFNVILGEEFKAYPHFGFGHYVNLKSGIDTVLSATGNNDILRHQGSTNAEKDEYMDDWLYGIARVQKKVDSVETIRLLTNDIPNPLTTIRPVQFPYILANTNANPPIPDTDYWLGASYPSSYAPLGDKTSISVFDPGQLSAIYDYYCGFMIDTWAEEIPFDSETTGIAFNYNQPSSKPPQNVLLAVSPQVIDIDEAVNTIKHWNVEDLLYTLLDTMDMSRMRMVEPDHFRMLVENQDFNQYTKKTADGNDKERSKNYEMFKWVLPAVVGDIIPKKDSAYQTLDEAIQNVSFDYNPNNDPIPGPPIGKHKPKWEDGMDNVNSELGTDHILTDSYIQMVVAEQQVLTNLGQLQSQIINLQPE